MLRYKLRTLLILSAILPPVLAFLWGIVALVLDPPIRWPPWWGVAFLSLYAASLVGAVVFVWRTVEKIGTNT